MRSNVDNRNGFATTASARADDRRFDRALTGVLTAIDADRKAADVRASLARTDEGIARLLERVRARHQPQR